MTGETSWRCRREATSGTMPPKRACRSACDATTLARTRPSRLTTAAAVSSHEVSSARILSFRGRAIANRLGERLDPSRLQTTAMARAQVRIVVDVHEGTSGIGELMRQLGAEVEIAALRAGDYLVGENTLVERKRVR